MSKRQIVVLVVLLALACALPFIVSPYRTFQFTLVIIYAIALLGLNILTGFNGQFSLGHGAFYAIGAYCTAILVDQAGFPYWATLPVSGAVCLLFGFLFGLPALRLEGLYLALATETRLRAESFERDALEFPADLVAAAEFDPQIKTILDGERQLFDVRKLELRGQLSIIEEQHEQLKNELDGLTSERAASLNQIGLTNKELAVVEELYKKGFTTRTRVRLPIDSSAFLIEPTRRMSRRTEA